MKHKGLRALQERIGYEFANQTLLARAVIHASARERRDGPDENERLEFLGDRVLALTIAELLYTRFPEASEGDLAKRFNRLVRRDTCAEAARAMRLGEHVVLSSSEKSAGGGDNVNILADACEALLGAVFLDGGLPKAQELILHYWQPMLQEDGAVTSDPKTALQEWAQGHRLKLPRYVEVARSGPDHDPLFVMEVIVERLEPQRGEGNSKRVAERNAAAALLVREGVWKENTLHD